MTRVAYLLWQFPRVSETFIQREVRTLRKLGCDVVVFADTPGASSSNDREWLHATVYVNPPSPLRLARAFWRFRPLALLRRIRREGYSHAKSLRFDLVTWLKAVYLAELMREQRITHVHAPWASHQAYLAALIGALLRVPYSVQARAFDIHRASEQVGLDVRLRAAAFVLTNSDYNRRRLACMVTADSLVQVYEGVDLGEFRPHASLRRGQLRVLAVGRLVEQKGFTYLLDACALLRDRGIVVHCEIIGGGQPEVDPDIEAALHRQRRSLCLDATVCFLGEQPFQYVRHAYTSADVVVLPSVVTARGDRDVTPNVLIEAMAMGLPVVATRVAAIPEIVVHGETGLLVPPRDSAALSEAIERLATDDHLRVRLGVNGRARAERMFDIERNLQHVARLFHRSDSGAGATPPALRSRPDTCPDT